MDTARTVFETVSAALGPRLRRIPDGETGARRDWITWLEPLFADNPAFEKSDEVFRVHATGTAAVRYRLAPGASLADVRFANLLYADTAIRSYADFAALKQAGKIPARCRFQVDLVPAHSVLWLFLQEHLHRPVDAIYNEALKREIDKLATAIPRDELAIQLDVASAVFARLQRNESNPYGADKTEMLETFSAILSGLGNHVPHDVELLFHFCYGDSNHRHVVEPIDMGDMVDLANLLMGKIARPIELIHMPVPRDRSDEAYFAPLRRLKLRRETQLCLGLVHYTDGVEGTRKRLATAERFVRGFSIATECGFGRRRPDTIPELLRIHAAVAGV
jgi:hypothetical protein